jgi:hypothetical protein
MMSIQQESLEKLGPRLRMICNGDEEVNALRALRDVSGAAVGR